MIEVSKYWSWKGEAAGSSSERHKGESTVVGGGWYHLLFVNTNIINM